MAVIIANSTATQWIPGRAHLKDSARSSPGASSSHHPRDEIFSIIFLHLRLPWIKFLLPPLLGQPRTQAVVIGCEMLKRLCIVSEADIFLKFSCFLYDPMYAGNLISGSSALSKPSLYIWKFLVRILLKSSLRDFEHNLTGL